ncbi:MAG TPA: thiamine pyrophosphate-dependent dehydrogenase E1 component subunit alpha [Dehalococcoidales bacterium]|nr:thiamine pyrophosphate-dependent dehydrogenase E1 component subunit alpha [Dehalococcoidales bacterium]
MDLDNKALIDRYRTMLTIRRFEERVSKEFFDGNVKGYVHLYIGEEAVATGVCGNLLRTDRIVSHHRGHGHCIAKGADINRMMAEIFGKKTGYCKGKGGSMHIADFGVGMLGANGIVGAGLPIACGAATAAQMEGGNGVAAVFFGDGGVHEGEFHEAMNLASVWKLPLIFVCENNYYAVNTPSKYAIAIDEIYKRAACYSMPGMAVDGNDVVAVHQAAKELVERARQGKGPSFLECRTYRWHGHFESRMPTDTRPPEEIAEWKKKDPVVAMERKLLAAGVSTQADLDKMNAQILERIDDAVKFAKESPFPAPEDALEDVYST